MLAANINWPKRSCSGSGIYAGRLGALESFVSESPTTKVLIAKVPIIRPDATIPSSQSLFELIDNSVSSEKVLEYETIESATELKHNNHFVEGGDPILDDKLLQDDMTVFNVTFLDFETKSNHKGKLCNGGVCCHYDIDVSDNGAQYRQVQSIFSI